MRFFRPLFPAPVIYPDAIFRMNTREKVLFLTFDDGPDPRSTPALLRILYEFNIKAVFFCLGKLAAASPGLMKAIVDSGSLTGNHCYNHPDGWKMKTGEYIRDVYMADPFTSSRLFRPPYGRLGPVQYSILKKKYMIFFWDLMVYDFDKSFSAGRSMEILVKKIRPGSVIVLHDKPGSSALQLLRPLIVHALNEGYAFALPFSGAEKISGS